MDSYPVKRKLSKSILVTKLKIIVMAFSLPETFVFQLPSKHTRLSSILTERDEHKTH